MYGGAVSLALLNSSIFGIEVTTYLLMLVGITFTNRATFGVANGEIVVGVSMSEITLLFIVFIVIYILLNCHIQH